MSKMALAVLAAAMPAWASAGAGLEKDRAGLESLLGETQRVAQAQVLETQNILKERPRGGPVGIPNPALAWDVLDTIPTCKEIVNRKFVRRPSIEEALGMLKPCVRALNAGGGPRISARKDSMEPIGRDRFERVERIVLTVHGSVPVGSTVVMNLKYSISKRNDQLLGWPAEVETADAEAGPAVGEVSSLQRVVDKCAAEVSDTRGRFFPIKNAADFAAAYKGCLKESRKLAIKEILPARSVPGSHPNVVWVFSAANQASIQAMNGILDVPVLPGSSEKFSVLIKAEKEQQFRALEN
ncbi:MAG: hypothetical protein HY549_05835 [Elusimicrobia bacterium]|nr:hypothetical protein [Elusimicrobiota bacterium]